MAYLLPIGDAMLTNKNFMLSDEQLAKYNEWAGKKSAAAFDADAGDSHEIEIIFSFSPYGRCVEARCGSEIFVLEEFGDPA